MDAARIADELALAMGFADASMEAIPVSRPATPPGRGHPRRGGGALPAAAAQVRPRAGRRGAAHGPGPALGPGRAAAVLLVAEAEGRDRSTIEAKRRRAHFPAGKTFESWIESRSSIPAAAQRSLRSLEWVGTGGEPGGGRALRGRASPICSRPSATSRRPGPVRGLVLRRGPGHHRPAPPGGRHGVEDLRRLGRRWRSPWSTTSGFCRSPRTPPKASIAWSMPPTSGAPWPCPPTCTPRGSTSSWTRPSPRRWSTGSCTTPTWS